MSKPWAAGLPRVEPAWPDHAREAAQPVPVWTRPQVTSFVAVPAGQPSPGGFSAWVEPSAPVEMELAEPCPDLDAIQADAFAQGFQAGHAAAEEAFAAERGAMADLAAALDRFQPEPSADLAALLAETVSRLVKQVMGEVRINKALLEKRTAAIAAQITEDMAPARLCLHPADVKRLAGVEMRLPVVPDPTLAPGTVRAETATGWIEDGPASRMERLRGLIEQLAQAK